MRYCAAPLESSRSYVPPMLGGPSCPPRNITDRSATAPAMRWPLRIHCHRPEFSLVGEPTSKRIFTVRVDKPSPNVASASRRSPSRVPRTYWRTYEARFSRLVRSSTDCLGGLLHAAMRTNTKPNGTLAHTLLGMPGPQGMIPSSRTGNSTRNVELGPIRPMAEHLLILLTERSGRAARHASLPDQAPCHLRDIFQLHLYWISVLAWKCR